MSTSKPGQPGNGAPNSYTRFIPREELGSFSAWNPETFEAQKPVDAGDNGGARKPTLAERAAAEMQSPMRGGLGRQGVNGAHAPHGANGAARPQGANGAAASPFFTGAATAPRPPGWRPVVGGVPGQAEAEERAAAEAEAAARAAAQTPPAPAPDVDTLVEAARQSGYQDGYRNGLAALEAYKQSQAEQFAARMSEQVGALASEFENRLESLEQQLAGRIAGVALELARQVVRSELSQHPEVVVAVAEEALGALLSSARQIVLRLHPDDHTMVQAYLTELLAARGARVVGDPSLTRGGCRVESDIAVVDASVEARWSRASAAMGNELPWNEGHEPAGPGGAAPSQAIPSSDVGAREA